MHKSTATLEREVAGADRRINELGRERDTLKKENAILERALKWYANLDRYPHRLPDMGSWGDKARIALERARKVSE